MRRSSAPPANTRRRVRDFLEICEEKHRTINTDENREEEKGELKKDYANTLGVAIDGKRKNRERKGNEVKKV